MNAFLWILQFLLAFHTVMGAVWKFSNPEQAVPSLTMIPHGVWLAMSVFELICSVGLILPIFKKTWGRLAPIAAIGIAVEMLIFSGVHIFSGATEYGSIIYWLVVTGVCAFIAYGRFVLRPINLVPKRNI